MISVCIATYNGERFIHRQIETILPQLSADDEIIVSDDGSSDDGSSEDGSSDGSVSSTGGVTSNDVTTEPSFVAKSKPLMSIVSVTVEPFTSTTLFGFVWPSKTPSLDQLYVHEWFTANLT